MKKFILLSLFLAGNLSAEFSLENLEKYVRQKHFENDMYKKVSTSQEDYYFYKGKTESYQEILDYINPLDEDSRDLRS